MNELEKKVLQNVGENPNSPDVFLDTDTGMEPVRDSLNDAIQELASLTGSISREYHIPLVSGQTFYRLNFTDGHFAWIQDAWLISQKRKLDQTDFIKLNADNPRWQQDSGSPHEYMQIGKDIIGFYRKPSDSSDVVKLNVVIIPDRYTKDTDRIMLRDDFEWAAAHYATSEFWANRGDAKEAIFWWGKYLEVLKDYHVYPVSRERTYQL